MELTAMAFKIFNTGRRRQCFCRLLGRSSTFRTLSKLVMKNPNASPWKVMFFGTDDFSLGSLSRLAEELETSEVVSKLEVVTSKWHLNPVRLYSKQKGLVVHDWPVDPHTVSGFDIGVVASFGHLIPKVVIDSFPLGMLNVHGSLLPRWRGASPVNYAIMHGDNITGISIMRIKPHAFDQGDVVAQREVQIHPTELASQLRQRLSEIGGDEIISCIQKLPSCLLNAKPQPDDGVTYAPKLTSNVGEVNFQKMTARCIFNKYRALYGIVPLISSWKGLRVILHDVSVCEDINSENQRLLFNIQSNATVKNTFPSAVNVPGQVFYHRNNKSLIVSCYGKSFLVIRRIAVLRKKPMSALEFYNGYLSKQDKTTWIFD